MKRTLFLILTIMTLSQLCYSQVVASVPSFGTEECDMCKGSGKCKYCTDGITKHENWSYKGPVACGTCNKTSKCMLCLGTGKYVKYLKQHLEGTNNDECYVNCPACHSYNVCKMCRGVGYRYCNLMDDCPNGKKDLINMAKYPCSECKGTGKCNDHYPNERYGEKIKYCTDHKKKEEKSISIPSSRGNATIAK